MCTIPCDKYGQRKAAGRTNEMPMKRVNIKAILASPKRRRRMMVGAIMALQHREGIMTTKRQALEAYLKVN